MIGAIFGLTLVVAGAAVFLRYSSGRLLRLWMARSALVTEQHNEALFGAVRSLSRGHGATHRRLGASNGPDSDGMSG